MRLKKLIKQYLECLEFEKGKSKSTVMCYTRYLGHFCKFTGNVETENVTYSRLNRFGRHLREYHKYNPNHINSILIALRGLLKHANARNIPGISFLFLEVGKKEDRHIVYLERKELKQLLKIPDIQTNKGLRDRAIMELLFSTGMRCGELTSLRRDQIKKSNSIPITGKGKRIRLIFLSKRARRWLDRYLKTRKDDYPPLFSKYTRAETGDYQQGLRSRSVERMVKWYAETAGISKDVTPHTFRHSFAVNLLENGADLFYVKELLGHRDITSTQIYLRASNRRLKEIHERFHIL